MQTQKSIPLNYCLPFRHILKLSKSDSQSGMGNASGPERKIK